MSEPGRDGVGVEGSGSYSTTESLGIKVGETVLQIYVHTSTEEVAGITRTDPRNKGPLNVDEDTFGLLPVTTHKVPTVK